MKNEVRGLKAGEYVSNDGTLMLRVSRNDNGVLVEIADMDADIFYAVRVDEKDNAKFDWGHVTPTSIQDDQGDSDAADETEL